MVSIEDIAVLLFVGACIAIGLSRLHEKYIQKKIDVNELLVMHQDLIGSFAKDQFDKKGRGAVLVSTPTFKGSLHKKIDNLGKFVIPGEENLVMDFVDKSMIGPATKTWYRPSQVKQVQDLIDSYDTDSEMLVMMTFPGLPIKTVVLDLKSSNNDKNENKEKSITNKKND